MNYQKVFTKAKNISMKKGTNPAKNLNINLYQIVLWRLISFPHIMRVLHIRSLNYLHQIWTWNSCMCLPISYRCSDSKKFWMKMLPEVYQNHFTFPESRAQHQSNSGMPWTYNGNQFYVMLHNCCTVRFLIPCLLISRMLLIFCSPLISKFHF